MKVGRKDNEVFQELERLNLNNEQLQWLRSSKTIGIGRKRARSRTTKKQPRDADKTDGVVDSSSIVVEDPVVVQHHHPKEESTRDGQVEEEATGFVQIDWNRLQWNTRKRNRNEEERGALVVDNPVLGPVDSNPEAELAGAESWKTLTSSDTEEKTPLSLKCTKKEQESTNGYWSNTYVQQLSAKNELESEDSAVVREEKNEKSLMTTESVDDGAKNPIIVERSKKEWAARMQLPIVEREQEIVELVNERDIVFIAAETGSGKTTQVPQFLYEAGYCSVRKDGYSGKIVVTQPRRVGAFACSSRVAKELDVSVGHEVGYHVRHFRKVSRETKIEFVTEGILLRWLQSDILLRRFSVVILDEAHERSMDTDLILGLVTRSVRLRRLMFVDNEKVRLPEYPEKVLLPPLKLIVMSATLDIDQLLSNEKLFSPHIPQPATLQVETRRYPVHIHFAKKTAVNYVDAAFKTVCKIHRQLPPGDVLVFLTGRREVLHLCRKLAFALQGTFPRRVQLPLRSVRNKGSMHSVRILPLYSMLPWKKQQRVFSTAPNECRTIIVATNIAETSITIPNIVYVVDSGRVKKKEYTWTQGENAFSMIRYHVKWTSQSSAEQRAGRAGRTCEGHCYRLYSAAVFLNEMEEQEEPAIQKTPADALLLKLKAFGVDVHSFPFPSPPSEEALETAERVLYDLGALYNSTNNVSVLSSLGRKLSKLPISCRLGKLVVESCGSSSMIAYALRIAALLTVSDIFLSNEEEERRNLASTRSCRMDSTSEILSILYSFCAWEYNMVQNAAPEPPEKYGFREKSVREVCLIINQLCRLVLRLGWIPKSWYPCMFPSFLQPPTRTERTQLIRTIFGCFPDQVCRHLSTAEATKLGLKGRKKREAFETACGNIVYLSRDRMLTQPVSSIDFVCYLELLDKSSHHSMEVDSSSNKHVYIRNCTVVTADMLVDVAASMCTFSQPLLYPPPTYDVDRGCVVCSVDVRFGPRQWPLGIFQVPYDEEKYSWNRTTSGGGGSSDWMMDRYRIFGQSFLRGQVFQSMAQWTAYLKESPDAMIRAPSLFCVMQLYMELHRHKIYRKEDCVRIWEKHPSFLLREYLSFLHEGSAVLDEISQRWPPL